jgi:ribosome-associated protein
MLDGVIRLAPNVFVSLGDVTFTASRSGGPGGQNVNNTSSKIELRCAVTAIQGMYPSALARLRQLAGHRVTTDDQLIITCEETRSMRSNKDKAIERLCELVREALVVPKVRRKTKPKWSSIQRRLNDKAQTGQKKRDRREPD